MNKEQEEQFKSIDFDYIYNLKRVKSAELEVEDFEEYGEELKKIIGEVIEQNYISKEEAKVNERKIKHKIYNDLMKIADDGEIEDLRVHVEDYFKDKIK